MPGHGFDLGMKLGWQLSLLKVGGHLQVFFRRATELGRPLELSMFEAV